MLTTHYDIPVEIRCNITLKQVHFESAESLIIKVWREIDRPPLIFVDFWLLYRKCNVYYCGFDHVKYVDSCTSARAHIYV